MFRTVPPAFARRERPRRIRKAAAWSLRAPADRLSLPAAAVVFGAGAALHATGTPVLDVALTGAVALPAVAYGVVSHRGRKGDRDETAWRAGKAALGAMLAGAWLATAARWGVAAGPDGLSAICYVAGTAAGYVVLRTDESVRGKRNWRNEKTAWLAIAGKFGLQGSHLLRSQRTRLGHAKIIDVTGTGKRASVIAGRDTAERIAEHYKLPATRVHVTAERIAGRVRISVRTRDPWENAIPHPLLDSDPEITLPGEQSVTEPLIIGQDPETGRPLTLDAYDAEDFGARAIMIISARGGGKTILLNDVMERLTACRDVLIWDINLSKAKENRRWAPACDLVAHGPGAKREALMILRLARKVVEYRGNIDGDDAIHQPSPASPAIVVRVDESKVLLGDQSPLGQAIREAMTYLNDTGRSEGVATVFAAQRGTITHVGSGDLRANADTFLLAKVRSRAEMMHAAGDMGMELPDMTSYGEGYPGVWLIGSHGGGYQTGRTFLLKHLPDIARIAASRPPRATLDPGLREYLGDAYEQLKAGRAAEQPSAPGWMTELAREMEDVSSDVFGQMDRIAQTNRDTKRQLDDLDADVPVLGPEYDDALAAAKAQRERQAAESVEIPGAHLRKILTLARDGAAMKDMRNVLQVSRSTVYRYLYRLRVEDIVACTGKGAGARWHLTQKGRLAAEREAG